MPTVDIPERVLTRLVANADARRVTLDAYLESVAATDAAAPARQLAAIESFAGGMGAHLDRSLPVGHVVDDSRESIYPERG